MNVRRNALLTVAVAAMVALSGCLAVVESAAREGVVVDSAPAEVSPAGLSATGYVELNSTDVTVAPPLPLVPPDRGVRVQAWVAVYGKGLPGADGDPTTAVEPASSPAALEEASVVTVVSMSALESGPVALNPLVYATEPRLLTSVAPLLTFAEFWLTGNLVDLTVTGSDPVTVLGQETSVTRLAGRLETPTGESVDVSLSLVSVVHEGDLVVVLGVLPGRSDGTDAEMRTLAGHVRHGG